PVLYGNLPPREISMKDVFRSGDSSKKFKIAEGQWYRYAPSYVSPAYHLLEGFPFIQEPPSGDLQERVLIRHHDYDQCFQSVQLLQWNSQVKFNVTDEFIAAVIAYYVHPVNIQTACLIMEGAEFTENIINGVERPVKAAELFAFTLRV